MTATAAERKARERARKAASGLTEVRGIYAPADLHAAIKAAARDVFTPYKAASCVTEVRGIYALQDLHAAIHAAASDVFIAYFGGPPTERAK